MRFANTGNIFFFSALTNSTFPPFKKKKKQKKKIGQELNHLPFPLMDVYFWALNSGAICHLQQVFLILHHETTVQDRLQLMTRPSYQLMMGEDCKLVPMSPSFSPFPPLPFSLHFSVFCSLSACLFLVINPSIRLRLAN